MKTGLVAQAEIQMSLTNQEKMQMSLVEKIILPRPILGMTPVLLMASPTVLKVPAPVLPSRRPLLKRAAAFLFTKPTPCWSR